MNFVGFKQTNQDNQTTPSTGVQTMQTKPTPMVLMRKYLNGKTEQLEVGDIVVDIRGKTYYITGWDEFKSTVQATSMCENHYFIDVPARTFNCYFVEV